MYHLTNTTEVHFHLSSAVRVRGFLPVKQKLLRMRTRVRRTMHATTRLRSRAVSSQWLFLFYFYFFLPGLSCWARNSSSPWTLLSSWFSSDVLKILRGYKGSRPDTREGDFANLSHTSYTAVIPLADHGYRLFRKPRTHFACTVEPHLTATSVIPSPRYDGHIFWPGKTAVHFLIKDPR